MSPKATFGLMFALCATLAVVRSGGGPLTVGGHKKVEISFWNGWTGPDGREVLKMIRVFNDANPDVHITMQRIDWATYYNKLMVAEVDKRGPEMFVIHASTLPRMVRAGFVGDASDLYTGPQGVPPQEFDSYVLNQVRFGNQMAGLPLDIHPQGMYCNVDMLKTAGFIDSAGNARPPQTKDEFMKFIRAAKITAPGQSDPTQWGFAFTIWGNNFRSLLPQFDGHYVTPAGRADLANPGNVAALSFLVDLAKQKLVPPPENGLGWVGFRQKRVAAVWDGVYMIGDLLRLDNIHYLGAPIPVIGNHPGTMADSHILCMKKGLTADQREGCERFIRYLSSHSIQWAAAGQVAARKSVRNTPAFANLQVQSAFAKQIPYMMYPPRTTTLFELGFEVDHAVEAAIRGTATAEAALQQATVNYQKILDRDTRDTSPQRSGL